MPAYWQVGFQSSSGNQNKTSVYNLSQLVYIKGNKSLEWFNKTSQIIMVLYVYVILVDVYFACLFVQIDETEWLYN